MSFYYLPIYKYDKFGTSLSLINLWREKEINQKIVKSNTNITNDNETLGQWHFCKFCQFAHWNWIEFPKPLGQIARNFWENRLWKYGIFQLVYQQVM